MSSQPRVGIVTPCRNRREKTARFLQCMREQQYGSLQVYLVDSNSSDGTPETIRRCFPEVVLLTGDDSKFWAGATNIGVRRALADGCEFLVTINDDSVVGPEWLSTLVAEAISGPFHILASQLEFLHEPGLLWGLGAYNDWASGVLFQLPDGNTWADETPTLAARQSPFEVQTLCGNGVLFRREVFEKTGLYDEVWTPHYHADSEFVLRARKHGFTPYLTTRTVVRNDVFNDASAPQVPTAPPPAVRPGDWVSLWRRLRHDGRILFFSVRSALYWRALLAYVWRHCPRSLLVPCVQNLTGRLWRQHFRRHWEAFRASAEKTASARAPVKLWRLDNPMQRSATRRGDLSMDALDDIDRADDDEFLDTLYQVLLGRAVDDSARGFRVASAPGGRDRVILRTVASQEARLLGLERRGTPLAKRMVLWRSAQPDA